VPVGYYDLDAKIFLAYAAVNCVLIDMVSYLAASWTIVIEDFLKNGPAFWKPGDQVILPKEA